MISEKNETRMFRGNFTTCNQKDDKCPPWAIYAEEVTHKKKERLRELHREICFCVVSCSRRACVRAGEAKLRERMRGTCQLNAGEENAQMFSGSGGRFSFFIFAAIRKGFKRNYHKLLLYARASRENLTMCY